MDNFEKLFKRVGELPPPSGIVFTINCETKSGRDNPLDIDQSAIGLVVDALISTGAFEMNVHRIIITPKKNIAEKINEALSPELFPN